MSRCCLIFLAASVLSVLCACEPGQTGSRSGQPATTQPAASQSPAGKPDASQPAAGQAATRGPEGTAGAGSASEKRVKIALIPKGTTHEFWKSVHAGGVKAARELGQVDLVWQGPPKEDDREQQISLVQNFISTRIDALVLAPLDEKALVPPVQQALAAKIPVVIIDSGLEGQPGKDYVSFAATDNYKGGVLAGERLVEVLGGKGNALLLRYQEGSNSTMERERGFVEALAKHPEVKLIDPKRYAGPTRATAQEAAENLLTAQQDIQGVFAPNESSSFGMLRAIRDRGLAGKVHFVGFDASPGLLEGLAKGDLDGLVVQDPLKMGYLGVKTAVDHLHGKPVPPRQDTGVVLVTKEMMEQPEFKELLHPDLAKYLSE